MSPGGPHRIQRLGAADLALARALNDLFARAFDDDASYRGAPPADGYLQATLANPAVVALAALDGGDVVGGLVAYELPKLERSRSEIYLYDLAVAAPQRRRGIATALIRALQDHARACGAWVVFVQADPGDDAAIALYTRLGVREDVLHFDLVG